MVGILDEGEVVDGDDSTRGLEAVLLSRNRKLEGEVTRLRSEQEAISDEVAISL